MRDYEREDIEEAIREDRAKLFELADQVAERAPVRSWNTLIVDGGSGTLVGEFLLAVLSHRAAERGDEAPNMIVVANSRHIARLGYRRQHRRSALQYLREEQVSGSALVVTDIVDSGRSLRRLGRYALALGIRPDFAILTTCKPERALRRKIGARRRSEVYRVHDTYEPYLVGGTFSQGLGLHTAPGEARMQQPPSQSWLGWRIRDAFGRLAATYLQERSSA